MRKCFSPVRPNFQEIAQTHGFVFHDTQDQPRWNESYYYQFNTPQIEVIYTATQTLHDMCMTLLKEVIYSEKHLQTLGLPFAYWDYIKYSYEKEKFFLCGRMDFCYDGITPPKLYELNYDTPTSIYEAAYFQWLWLDDLKTSGHLSEDTEQYNFIQDALIEQFASLSDRIRPNQTLYFSAEQYQEEDIAITQYLRDCANESNLNTQFILLNEIGLNREDQFVDTHELPIAHIFKFYPWEFMFSEEFGVFLPLSKTRWLTPAWTWVLSNKGFLALLWEQYQGHANLLETHIEANPYTELAAGWVRKQFLSRDGANIHLHTPAGQHYQVNGPYYGQTIRQQCCLLPEFTGRYPVTESWIVGEHPVGIGIREDSTCITQRDALFIPHCVNDE